MNDIRPISPRDFEAADGLEDWRILGDGASIHFPTKSLAASARLARAISEIPDVDGHPPGAIHIGVWVPREQAQARIQAALAAGGRMVRDEFAPSWWTLADPAGNEADIATVGGRG